MKKLILVLVMLLMPSMALAEGIWTKPGKSYQLEAELPDWSGSYLGLSALWLYDFEETPLGIGGTLGMRKHFQNNLVLGAELDLAYTGWAESALGEGGFAKLTWLGSARVVAGYSVGVFLPYASIGWGIGGWQMEWSQEEKDSGTVNGLVWGGGVETKLSTKTSLKLDWSRYEFGEVHGIDMSQDVVSVKLNLKF